MSYSSSTLNYTFLYVCICIYYCSTHVTLISFSEALQTPEIISGSIVNTRARQWRRPGKPVGFPWILQTWPTCRILGWGEFQTCHFRLHWSGSRLLVQEEPECQRSDTDTVDGRNPAPVSRWLIYCFTMFYPTITRFYTSQVVIAGFLKHQQ